MQREIISARLVLADPSTNRRCHTCDAERRWQFWLNGACLCENCVDICYKNNPYILQSKAEEHGMGGARQVGIYFVSGPGRRGHPRGPSGEDWPDEEQGWAVFESVTDGTDDGERYYDMKHSIQCKTVAEAKDLVDAAKLILEELKARDY